ncbi:MAG TPA: SDR family oxidoreductase [Candidatus Brocadiia bacterium]|nr:SDR family oxidoreductase [Candidatus Brocadiia bacterium]
MKLRDQVVLITGGGRGIGRAIAHRFAAEGAHLALAARTFSEVQKVVSEIRSFSEFPAVPLQVDVAKLKDVHAMVRAVETELGPIDILVNNAGIAKFVSVNDTTLEDWDNIMGTNARGVFLCSKTVLRNMMNRKKGHIINIASQAAKRGYANQAAYCASKHAVLGFSKALALETRDYNIRVHVICPGGVDTDLVDLGRGPEELSKFMQPPEIAEVALFVATQEGNAMVDEIVVRRLDAPPWMEP